MWVDEFIKQLQGKYMWLRNQKVPNQPVGDYLTQVAVRPIELWEIVFPKGYKDVMLTTLFGQMSGARGVTHQKKHRKWVALIRRLLGVQKIPEKWDDSNMVPITKEHMEIIGVGMKDDEDIKKEDCDYEGL